MKVCPFCAEDIKAAAIVCRYCGRDLPRDDTAAVPAAPAPVPMEAGGDRVYYSDEAITVTRSRVTMGEKSLAMANVTAVIIDRDHEGCGCGALLVLLALFTIPFLWVQSAAWLGLVGVACMIWGVRLMRAPAYVLSIRDNSEQAGHSLRSKDHAYLQKIADAVNQAFADRR